jgi:hypothetical protein
MSLNFFLPQNGPAYQWLVTGGAGEAGGVPQSFDSESEIFSNNLIIFGLMVRGPSSRPTTQRDLR